MVTRHLGLNILDCRQFDGNRFMCRLSCCLSLLCIVNTSTFGQQNNSVTLQEKMTFSDSVDATVTVVSGDIKAGEPFDFTLKLDKVPSFKTGAVQYTVAGPANETFGTSCYQTQEDAPGHYHCEFTTAVTAAGGIWKIKEIHFAEGVTASGAVPWKPQAISLIDRIR